MVYVKSALAGAVAMSIVSGVSALPTSPMHNNNNNNPAGNQNPSPALSNVGANMAKRDGPMVVEAKSLRAVKRNYVGGGSSEKGVRQAPLVKTSKLFRSKRNIVEARDSVHAHIHEHDHDYKHDDHRHHHHHNGKYDPHHSEHYNWHHGLGKRSLVNVQALNFDSPIGNKSVKKINNSKTVNKFKEVKKVQKCSGKHYHCDNHKRSEENDDGDAHEQEDDDADDESGEDEEGQASRLVRRRRGGGHRKGRHGGKKYHHGKHYDHEEDDEGHKKHKSKGGKGNKSKHGSGNKEGHHKPGSKLKAHSDATARDLNKREAEEETSRLEARHRHHHSNSWWRHHHDYKYSHGYTNAHIHSHEHHHKARDLTERHHHNDDWYYSRHGRHRYDHWLDDMKHDRKWKDGHAHIHLHEHSHRAKRDLPGAAGIPGFVEVASTLFHSNLVKSVAGLVFSKDSNASSSDFILGTSESQSTQFYLVPSTAASATDAVGQQLDALPVNATAAPVNDMEGDVASKPQMYELRIPVLDSKTLEKNDYCATFDVKPPSPLSMQPCGQVDGFSQLFNYNQTTGELVPVYPATATQSTPLNAAVNFAAATAPQNVTSTVDAVASTVASNTTAANATETAAHEAADDDESSMAPKVSLFFIPSSPFDEKASDAGSMPSPVVPGSPTDDANAVFSAPAQIKAAADPAQGQDPEADDALDGNNEDDADVTVVTTTVVVTSTVDAAGAPSATPTDASDTGMVDDDSSSMTDAASPTPAA